MTTRTLFVSGLLIGTLLTLAGCGSDTPTNSATQVPLVRTVPSDGGDNVPAGDPIIMMFSSPVDTARFHEWFDCVDSLTHDALQDSLGQGMMGMGGMHADSAEFFARMHDRAVDGTFRWNNDGDSCVYLPDSILMDDTEYVLHFRHQMKDDHGQGMRHMGREFEDDLMVRFHTARP